MSYTSSHDITLLPLPYHNPHDPFYQKYRPKRPSAAPRRTQETQHGAHHTPSGRWRRHLAKPHLRRSMNSPGVAAWDTALASPSVQQYIYPREGWSFRPGDWGAGAADLLLLLRAVHQNVKFLGVDQLRAHTGLIKLHQPGLPPRRARRRLGGARRGGGPTCGRCGPRARARA